MEKTVEQSRQRLKEKIALSLQAGGEKRIEKQHAQGKYTARERIHKLVDPGTFIEFDQFVTHKCSNFGLEEKKILGDGVVTGIAKMGGSEVALFSHDFTCFGGALGMAFAKKVCKVMDFAVENRIPIIGINDSGGARIQEGVESLAGYADIFHRNVKASGVIPQISVIMGPCAGGAVYSPAMTDYIFMVDKTSYMFITGPEVIKTVTHEEVTKEELGGAKTHNEKSGVAHFFTNDEDDCFERVRELMFFIGDKTPMNSNPQIQNQENLKNIVPANPKKPYDITEIILNVVDDNHLLEVQKDFAKNIVCGFAKLAGKTVGIVANQPAILAGVLDIDASTKAARFVRYCDAFDIPIITFVDVPGFLPGTDQEYGGIIRHGAKLLYAYSEATVPLITLITRKAYGGAYDVMASKHIGADINLSYPTGEIAVMGAEGAVNILYRNELKKASDPDKVRNEFMSQYEDEFANPYQAASLGYLDEIIYPEETRQKLVTYLSFLKNKKVNLPKRKHGNIPL
ncbi:acyl-CoA carboxylase subunit beta [Bacteriovoracaceae bacterium]|nr:acyl-CoA carboxylase subunit beta [Bacteriovoracaceae bacterium]